MPYTQMEPRREMRRLYYERGQTVRQIARSLNLPPSTVHYSIHRVEETKPKSGRPRITTSEMDQRIFEMSSAWKGQ